MRTRGCWRNLFKIESRCEVCSIEHPYYVSTVHQDALFTNIIPQSYQLNRAFREELICHFHKFQASGLWQPFRTCLGCPLACLSQRCLNSLGLLNCAPDHPTSRGFRKLRKFLHHLRERILTITSLQAEQRHHRQGNDQYKYQENYHTPSLLSRISGPWRTTL
jgi:hypothetical protein